MELINSKGKTYIILDFTKVWRFIPIRRPGREIIKWFLFGLFPMFFRRLADYQNWLTSRIYTEKREKLGFVNYWKRKLFNHYNIEYPTHKNKNGLTSNNTEHIAIIVHVFYLDVFREILKLLKGSDFQNLKLFVTTPNESADETLVTLKSTSFQFSLHVIENRGRDVLPFISILPEVFNEGYELILKIHTKRSNHLKSHEVWREDLFVKLVGRGAINSAIRVFESHKEIGIIGPIGHIVPMSHYYGANAGRVELLSKKLGLDRKQLAGFNFVAGTMFFARKAALLPILALGLTDRDFEPENNQLDGTMAHAIERAFTSSLRVAGLKLADTSSTPERVSCRVDLNYKFIL